MTGNARLSFDYSTLAGEPQQIESHFLADVSSRDRLWDKHKLVSDRIAEIYSTTAFERYAPRIRDCASRLYFALKDAECEDAGLKLHSAFFCRVPQCQVCNWRRSQSWRAKFFKILPKLISDNPGFQFIYLTLTVRNCDLRELREQLKHMSQSWDRLVNRKDWITFVGFVRSVEVTRSYDIWYKGDFIGRMSQKKYYEWRQMWRDNWQTMGTLDTRQLRIEATWEVHPHYHAMLMVPDLYFDPKYNYYWNHARWVQEWRSALRVDYNPSVYVEAVKSFDEGEGETVYTGDDIHAYLDNAALETDFNLPSTNQYLSNGLIKACLETLKYSVKVGDIVGDIITHPGAEIDNSIWLENYTNEVFKMRKLNTGGVFKEYLKELELDSQADLIRKGEQASNLIRSEDFLYSWQRPLSKYLFSGLI